MNLDKIREEVQRLLESENIDTYVEVLEIFAQCLSDFIIRHNNDHNANQSQADARMVVQIMFSKLIHLRKLLSGSSHVDRKTGKETEAIIDPLVINSLVRTVFETACMFFVVFRKPDTDEKKLILYNLWVISGLKYRQKFRVFARTPENVAKSDAELALIGAFENEIKNSNLFNNLNEKNQNKILTKIKEKDYKITIEDDIVNFLSWQQIADTISSNTDLFETMYTYFSLYSHPSNVSVFQFREMFRKERQDNIGIVLFNLRYCVSLTGMFIADYINLFPNVLETFKDRTGVEQIVLNFHNRFLRGDDFSISDLWRKL